jgi:peptide/nickel transport system substrate-binding protein
LAAVQGLGPFRVEKSPADEVRYLARRDTGEGGPEIREVVERRMSALDALEALVHGDVDLIARVSPPHARKLRQQRSLRVLRLEAPEMHVITFNFNRPELRSHTLRRALMYGIDRRSLLEEVVLGGAADARNTLAEGPFVRESYANLPNLEPIPYNPLLARGLVETARREFDGHLPRLTFAYSPRGPHREVCERIQENWQQIGLDVALVEQGGNQSESSAPDLIYRTYQLFDPVRETPEIVMGFRGATASDFPASVSPWLSSLLVGLERAEDWLTARDVLRSIHKAVHDLAVLVPLWQVDVLFAHRAELVGRPETSLSLYQDIERWKIGPVMPD